MAKDFEQVVSAIISLDAELNRKATNQEVADYVFNVRGGARSCSYDTITKARRYLERLALIGDNQEPKLAYLGRVVLEAVSTMVEVNGGQAALEKHSLAAAAKIEKSKLQIDKVFSLLPSDQKEEQWVKALEELRDILMR